MTSESIRSETVRDKEVMFHADLESLRKENQRLHKNLSQALEERNRLMKRRSQAPTPAGHATGSRVLDQRLEETRLENLRQRREIRELKEQNDRLERRVADAERFHGLLLERLQELAEIRGGDTRTGASTGGRQVPDDRFEAAVRGIVRRLEEKKSLVEGVVRHEIERLRGALEEKQKTLLALERERDGLASRLAAMDNQLVLRQKSLEETREDSERTGAELAASLKERAQLAATAARLELRIRRLQGSRGLRRFAALTRLQLRRRAAALTAIAIGCGCGIALALVLQRTLDPAPQTPLRAPPAAAPAPHVDRAEPTRV